MDRKKRHRRPSGRREDGAATKQQVLEAAGEVFAEKGVGYATGKEIAEKAGINSAAVNYYFGGIEGLYAEVLVEAHHRLMDYGFLKKVSEAPGSPEEKLSIFIEGMLRAVLVQPSWALRVLGREMIQPSAAFPVLREREILPKKQIAATFISQILGVPPEHPAVARSGFAMMAPYALLLIGNREMLVQAAFPDGLPGEHDRIEAVVKQFRRFAMGGLAAIAADIQPEKASGTNKELK